MMNTNSIEYITKKHFRSASSIAVTLMACAIAALSVFIAYTGAFQPAAVAFSVFAVLSALFTVIRVFSVKTGCTLLRISVAFTAGLLFFAAMIAFTLGYLLLRNGDIQTVFDQALSERGWVISTSPSVTGGLLFALSALLYFASGCAFFAHRYLRAVRSCASGSMKRIGLRVFPFISVILSLLSVGGAVAFALLSHGMIDRVLSDRLLLAESAVAALVMIHPLFAGICASSFARRTFAFKVFENQIMKVETNADGTVYVPINEDTEPDAEEPLLPAKTKSTEEEHLTGKPYIREYSPASAADDKNGRKDFGEADLL